jgi:ELWxxDGT repeat protein
MRNKSGILMPILAAGIATALLCSCSSTRTGSVPKSGTDTDFRVDRLTDDEGLDASNLCAVEDHVFFSGTGWNGTELFVTDGTRQGTYEIRDINPFGSSSPGWLTASNGTLFFTANDGTNGTELWKSDGTDAGTVMIKDIFRGSTGSDPAYLLDAGNGTIYFQATHEEFGEELWVSDGTNEGTQLVMDVNAGAEGSFSIPEIIFGQSLLFSADDGLHGREVWRSDGTQQGTFQVKDIAAPGDSDPGHMVEVTGIVYFAATEFETGRELWRTDGTEAGTWLVMDIAQREVREEASNPTNLWSGNNVLYFGANDGWSGNELWRTDGTEAGTWMVSDLNPGSEGSWPVGLGNPGGFALLVADNGREGRELWRVGDDDASLVLVKDISDEGNGLLPPPENEYFGYGNVAAGGGTIFLADDGVIGVEPWFSDGTALGTRLVLDSNPHGDGPNPALFESARGFAVMDGSIFFGASDGTDHHLWSVSNW